MDEYAFYIIVAYGSAVIILGILSLSIALKYRALTSALKAEDNET